MFRWNFGSFVALNVEILFINDIPTFHRRQSVQVQWADHILCTWAITEVSSMFSWCKWRIYKASNNLLQIFSYRSFHIKVKWKSWSLWMRFKLLHRTQYSINFFLVHFEVRVERWDCEELDRWISVQNTRRTKQSTSKKASNVK